MESNKRRVTCRMKKRGMHWYPGGIEVIQSVYTNLIHDWETSQKFWIIILAF